jgi:hypothetical protein
VAANAVEAVATKASSTNGTAKYALPLNFLPRVFILSPAKEPNLDILRQLAFGLSTASPPPALKLLSSFFHHYSRSLSLDAVFIKFPKTVDKKIFLRKILAIFIFSRFKK